MNKNIQNKEDVFSTIDHIGRFALFSFPAIMTLIVLFVKLQIEHLDKFQTKEWWTMINTLFLYKGMFWVVVICTVYFGLLKYLKDHKIIPFILALAFASSFFLLFIPIVNDECRQIIAIYRGQVY